MSAIDDYIRERDIRLDETTEQTETRRVHAQLAEDAMRHATAPEPQAYVGARMAEGFTINPDATVEVTPDIGTPQEPPTTTDRPIFNVGDLVKIVQASRGWGTAVEGDVATVEFANPDSDDYRCIISRTNSDFYCRASDIEKLVEDEQAKRRRILAEKEGAIYRVCIEALPIHRNHLHESLVRVHGLQRNKQKQLQKLAQYASSIHTLINSASARASSDSTRARVREQSAGLVDIYESVFFGGNNANIVGITKKIEYDIAGMHIVYGQYEVSVDYIDGKIRVKPHSDVRLVREQYTHPNVLKNGEVCFGTYSNTINVNLAEKNIAHVLWLCYDLLSNKSDDGAYQAHGYWADDVDERCNRCWKLHDDCECRESSEDTCVHCDNIFDNCECVICPNSSEPLEDNSFPDGYCTGECSHYARRDDEPSIRYCDLSDNLGYEEEED